MQIRLLALCDVTNGDPFHADNFDTNFASLSQFNSTQVTCLLLFHWSITIILIVIIELQIKWEFDHFIQGQISLQRLDLFLFQRDRVGDRKP